MKEKYNRKQNKEDKKKLRVEIEENSSISDVFSSIEEEALYQISLVDEGQHLRFFKNSLFSLSRTSMYLRAAVSLEIKARAVKLVQHVVLGEQDEAEALIQECPELLLYKAEVVDYSGRKIIATPFQAAIGAGDKQMWELMLPYFKVLEDGEALRQFNEQFPNGIDVDLPAEELKLYYNAIALAIINAEDNGISAIEAFREEIKSQNVISQGMHFNLQELVAAYRVFIDYSDVLDWNKRDLFWLKIIGFVQRQMTAYDAQALLSGIETVLVDEANLSRSLILHNDGFFSLAQNSALGFDFAVVGLAQYSYPAPVANDLDYNLCSQLCEKFYSKKIENLTALRETLEPKEDYQCVIC